MTRITLTFCGDYAPCRRFESLVRKKGSSVLKEALPIIQASDIAFVNLECVLTGYNKPIKKSGPALKASPECIEPLTHFDVVGLANNHILDFGAQGVSDTINLCNQNGIPTVGAGANLEEAQRVFYTEIKGVVIALIAVAEHEFNIATPDSAGAAPIDEIDNYHQITSAKERADLVIVTLHGGNEYFPYPRPGLRKLCKYYVDVGADAVICHHPHVAGAYELYKEAPIVYSLGNFLFDRENAPEGWDEGYMFQMHFDPELQKITDYELIPYRQSIELAGLKVLEGKHGEAFLQKIESHREKLKSQASYEAVWEEFAKSKANSYILRQYMPFTFRGLGFLGRNTPLSRWLTPKRSILAKLNMIRCQSHKELLQKILEIRS